MPSIYQFILPTDINPDNNGGNTLSVNFTAATDTTLCVNITIIQDDVSEQNESFTVAFFTTEPNVTTLLPTAVGVTILSCKCYLGTYFVSILLNPFMLFIVGPPAVLTFEESNYLTTEDGPVEVCVVVQGGVAERRLDFQLEVVSGTATSESVSAAK